MVSLPPLKEVRSRNPQAERAAERERAEAERAADAARWEQERLQWEQERQEAAKQLEEERQKSEVGGPPAFPSPSLPGSLSRSPSLPCSSLCYLLLLLSSLMFSLPSSPHIMLISCPTNHLLSLRTNFLPFSR